MTTTPLHQLADRGQSVWLDLLSRKLIHGGDLERLVREDALAGVTSNPTIFQKAIAGGEGYDEQLRELAQREDDPRVIFRELAVRDIADACDVLRPVWDRTSGRDGFVSLEVDPDLAFDADATVDEAIRLHGLVDRPNLLVKIPATEPGLTAIEESIARGIPINVTLIFSLERYERTAEAYLRGLERLVEAGGDPSRVASVASFFVSRVDTEIDRRLDEIGAPGELKAKMAIANAKLAYERYQELFAGDRWDALRTRGATPQRCLWASTSTKDPSLPDTYYVEALIGPETVDTMPLETLEAFRDHGTVADTLTAGVDEARETFEKVAAAGVDLEDVWETLEREGVEKFSKSFEELLEGVSAKRSELAGASA
jgi:transaldolase